MKDLFYLSFSDKGEALAHRLAEGLGGKVSRCGGTITLSGWTRDAFPKAQGLVFVGAAGIAVRAIAPWLKSKTQDPAVIVVDECAHFAIPILSGHLGGANDLAQHIAEVCGAIPVLTTATDANGVFAVDEWAKRQSCKVINPGRIKSISSAVLSGRTIQIYSPWPISGTLPEFVGLSNSGNSCDVCLDVRAGPQTALYLAPQILVLGIGCRKGISQDVLEEAFHGLLQKSGIFPETICEAASIDLKQEESGLLAFCETHGWPCRFYSAAQLAAVQGDFTPSDFVQHVTGVNNVCERSAVLAADGVLFWKKCVGNGVTMALAQRPYAPTWRWQNHAE